MFVKTGGLSHDFSRRAMLNVHMCYKYKLLPRLAYAKHQSQSTLLFHEIQKQKKFKQKIAYSMHNLRVPLSYTVPNYLVE